MDVEIRGLPELMAKLSTAQLISILRPPMYRSVLRLQAFMAHYPPRRKPEHRRTGLLGRRWTHEVTTTENGIIATIGNNTSYGPFVQSEQFQAGVHRDYWQTDEDSITDSKDEIIRDFEDTVQEVLNR